MKKEPIDPLPKTLTYHGEDIETKQINDEKAIKILTDIFPFDQVLKRAIDDSEMLKKRHWRGWLRFILGTIKGFVYSVLKMPFICFTILVVALAFGRNLSTRSYILGIIFGPIIAAIANPFFYLAKRYYKIPGNIDKYELKRFTEKINRLTTIGFLRRLIRCKYKQHLIKQEFNLYNFYTDSLDDAQARLRKEGCKYLLISAGISTKIYDHIKSEIDKHPAGFIIREGGRSITIKNEDGNYILV